MNGNSQIQWCLRLMVIIYPSLATINMLTYANPCPYLQGAALCLWMDGNGVGERGSFMTAIKP